MLKFVIGNNVSRQTVLVDEDSTVRSALEDAGIDISRGALHLDGATLGPGQINKTFRELGYTTPRTDGGTDGFLLSVVKTDNA